MQHAFLSWSRHVEHAVDKAIKHENQVDPIGKPMTSLHASHRGRCSFKQVLHCEQKNLVKSDRHGGYTPQCEVLSLRCRLKIRQVRRLKTLCRRYKTLPLTDSGCPCDDPALHDAYLEWKSILKATGYGNSWKNWILSFEVIPAVTFWLPTYEVLDTMIQITQHDCDHACRDESNKRAQRFCAKVHIDVQDDYGRMCYKLIQAKESSPLAEVPVSRTTTARLLRSTHGQTALMMDDNFEIPPFSKLSLDDAVICLVRQEGKKLFFRHVSGTLPACGCLTVSFVAVTSDEIGNEFLRFWSKMWLRDHRSEQFDCTNWRSFCDLLDATSMPATPQIAYPFSCVKTWMRLIRSLPAGKAVGPCGWSNDELKLLPECCISDHAGYFRRLQ